MKKKIKFHFLVILSVFVIPKTNQKKNYILNVSMYKCVCILFIVKLHVDSEISEISELTEPLTIL